MERGNGHEPEFSPLKKQFLDISKEEKEFEREIPNQFLFRSKKVEGYIYQETTTMQDALEKDEENRIRVNDTHFTSIKRELILKSDGKAFITFDVSHFKGFSVVVINLDHNKIKVAIEVSPDNIHFIKLTSQSEIAPTSAEVYHPKTYLKYLRIKLYGQSSTKSEIYLQGQK